MNRELTNISYIKDLCQRYGFALQKSYGQNFIVNSGICPKIAEHAEVDENCGVIEIGTGIGVLTKELALRAKKVVAIEIDTKLLPLLEETLSDFDNIKIINKDVLEVDLNALIKEEFGDMPVMVCANLPYYITSPIIMKLLEDRLPIENITVMVQKEAAQRICAKEGSRDAGAISLAVNYYAVPTVCFNVSPGSFFPPPKVTSSVIRLDVNKAPKVQPKSEKNMFRLIRAAFTQRRKTFVNSTSATLGISKAAIEAALEQIGEKPMVRPEQMTLEQFCALSDILLG
ncbi:MAG: 16S rRNA (adenine(1518)-N(6)/adenine(1519)-N(6))-dimethyltransferase RsmA [Oscillospiraceae bacterium]|nr:16S rRNA (adenine(1518)-N(6)/adenine(1519)-N(6))-dimethyltransferase RsmA [Oscillospiraceae bacterium]